MSSFAQLAQDVSLWTSSMRELILPTTNNEHGNDGLEQQAPAAPKRRDSQIVSDVLSKAMRANLFTRFLHPDHRKAAQLCTRFSHNLNVSYPPSQSLKPVDLQQLLQPNTNSTLNLLHALQYCMRCAFLAYPPPFVAVKSEEASLTFKSPRNVLKTCLKISDEDILIDNISLKLDNLVNKSHEPCFYLIVDHNSKRIVLSIRGTLSIGDVVTDLNADCQKVGPAMFGAAGYVHQGMLQSAQFVHSKVTVALLSACTQYPDYAVWMVGHSMGAAVASLLGLLYRNHPIIHQQNRLKVFSFASPCVVSASLSDLANDYVISVALGTDVVTRLSLQSVYKFNLRQDLIRSCNQEMIARCMDHAAELQQEADEGTQNDSCPETDFLRIFKTAQSPNPEQELFPLGRVLWFVPNAVMNAQDENGDDEDEQKQMDVDECDAEKGGKEKARQHETTATWMSSTWDNLATQLRMDRSASDLWREVQYDITRKVSAVKSEIEEKLDESKRRARYDSSNYTVVDATQCRVHVFQELVFDFPESLDCHEPQRYLWCCNAKLRM